MDRPPDVDRLVDERHDGEAEDADRRRRACPSRGRRTCAPEIAEMKVISSSSAIVSFASHCHQTPHALRPHSGPVTSPIRPKSDGDLGRRHRRSRSARGLVLNRWIRLATPQIADRGEHREPRRARGSRRSSAPAPSSTRTARARSANGAHDEHHGRSAQQQRTERFLIPPFLRVHRHLRALPFDPTPSSAARTSTAPASRTPTSNAASIADPHDRGRLVAASREQRRPCRARPQ